MIKVIRVACPKFGQPTLGSDFRIMYMNTEYVAAIGILRKKLNHHSRAEIISKFTKKISMQKLRF